MFDEKQKKIEGKIPYGFRDIFPIEAEERNSIRELIKKEFELWGYGEIKTPVVEFTRNISIGVGKNWENKLINFFDSDGSLVSLRTDMTIPIARFTGMRIKKNQLPVRFCYFANSFRRSMSQKGEKREYNQAGLELIGSPSYMCDVEILLILINLLKKLISDNFLIGIGSAKLINTLYDWLGLNESEKQFIRNNLILKNFVAIQEFLDKRDQLKSRLFLYLIKPHSNKKEFENLILETGSENVLKEFSYLKNIYEILSKFGFEKFLIFNVGVLRDFNYYTGVIFEVYSSNINSVIGSGGRYDKLIMKFGLDVPATGFALDIDLLHKSIKESSSMIFNKKLKILLASQDSDYLSMIGTAEALRKKNIIVELYYDEIKNFEEAAKENKADMAVIINNQLNNVEVINLNSNAKSTMELVRFLENFK